MPDHEYVLIQDPPGYLRDELKKRGFKVTEAYLGDLGYTTDDHIELACDAIDELMSESQEWTPIVWNQLEPDAQRKLMLMAADSDTFMEKGRLMRDWVYEEQINCILDLGHDHITPCHKQQSTEDQVPHQS